MGVILGIDPGQNGAIACRDFNGKIFTVSLDGTDKDTVDAIKDIQNNAPDGQVKAFLENVGGYRPGNSGPASVKFARSVGKLEGMLIALGIALERVAPAVWMKALGALPKDKSERKRKIKALMQEQHPTLAVTLSNADALGILTWAIKNDR